MRRRTRLTAEARNALNHQLALDFRPTAKLDLVDLKRVWALSLFYAVCDALYEAGRLEDYRAFYQFREADYDTMVAEMHKVVECPAALTLGD